MTYCDQTVGSAVRLNGFTEEHVRAAIWQGVLDELPALLVDDSYERLEPQLITEAATLADVFAGFQLALLRDDANELAAIKSVYDPWIDPLPLLRRIAPYLVRGSWYAVVDDNGNGSVYVVDPAVPDSLRHKNIGIDGENLLWVVPLSEYKHGYDHNYWYQEQFPQGPPFGPEAPYDVKLTAMVRAVTMCGWLLPCFAGGEWE